jgi:hypothetical protein
VWDSVLSVRTWFSGGRELGCNDDCSRTSLRSRVMTMTPETAGPLLVVVDGYQNSGIVFSCGSYTLSLTGTYH